MVSIMARSPQTDTEIANEFIGRLESLLPENDAPVSPEELNSANSTADIIEDTGTRESGLGMLDIGLL